MSRTMLSELRKLIPSRDSKGHKGTFGTLSVIAGSSMYRGAAALNISAALRCGVGIVRLVSSEKVISSVASQCNECVYCPIGNSDDNIMSESLVQKLPVFIRSNAILMGCGMTDCDDTRRIIEKVIKAADCQLIIDADGLNSIKDEAEILLEAKLPPIITPHVKELSRLSGTAVDEVNQDLLGSALEFSSKYNCYTVLKSFNTALAAPCGRAELISEKAFSDFSQNSGLAKGGSGDVLSGITASLSAQGVGPFDSMKSGVLLHSLAARLAADRYTEYSMMPSDIISMIPEIIKKTVD